MTDDRKASDPITITLAGDVWHSLISALEDSRVRQMLKQTGYPKEKLDQADRARRMIAETLLAYGNFPDGKPKA